MHDCCGPFAYLQVTNVRRLPLLSFCPLRFKQYFCGHQISLRRVIGYFNVYQRLCWSHACLLHTIWCSLVGRWVRPGNVSSPLPYTPPSFVLEQRVLGTFTAVGIFEQWELSMRLFDATVKSPVRRWNSPLAVNPGSRSPEREHLLEWAHTNADLHSLVSADLLLYEYALSLFRKQTRDALGVAFA